MKPRLIVIFLLLVLSPLVLLAWLGWRATIDEKARVEATISEAYSNQLTSLRSLIHETIAEREREFSNLLDPSHALGASDYRQIVRTQRFVRQIFVVQDDGNFIHPPRFGAACTAAEKGFFERTESVWSSGALAIFSNLSDNPHVNPPPAQEAGQVFVPGPQIDGQQLAQQREANPAWHRQNAAVANTPLQYVQEKAPVKFAAGEDWHTWFHGDGVQMIYWKKAPWATLGIEVDREALMAEVIAKLPADTGAGAGSIVLTDASAEPIYQWGGSEPDEDATPTVSIPLFAPLGMWHLNLYAANAAPGELSTSDVLSLVSGIIAAAVALLALAFYFYRENSREMRNATEKVTFVNQVSHELKTPLTNIRMYAELADEKIPEESNGARRCLDIVVNESQRLSRLIGNVLTFAKPKPQEPNPTPNVPDDLIRETLDHFRPAFAAQKIEVDFDGNASRQVRLDADIF